MEGNLLNHYSKIMRHLTAIFLILIIAMASSCKFFKEKKLFGKKDRLMAEWQAKQDSIRVADSIKRVNDNLLAGRYAVEFSAAGLASGMYIYRLESGGFIASKLLTLIK